MFKSSKFKTAEVIAALMVLALVAILIVWKPGTARRLVARPLPPSTTPIPGEFLPQGTVILNPSSSRIVPGRSYRFTLYTHCGLDSGVDFDGSMWDFDSPGREDDGSGNPPPGFGNPEDKGTIKLVSRSTAEFLSSSGKVARYRRHAGGKQLEMCM